MVSAVSQRVVLSAIEPIVALYRCAPGTLNRKAQFEQTAALRPLGVSIELSAVAVFGHFLYPNSRGKADRLEHCIKKPVSATFAFGIGLWRKRLSPRTNVIARLLTLPIMLGDPSRNDLMGIR